MNISKFITAVLLLGWASAPGCFYPSGARAETAAELTLQYSEEYKRGDFQAAEAAARYALAVETDQLGPSSPDLIPFRRDLAMIEVANGHSKEAAEELRELVNQAEAGGYRSTLASLLLDLASVLRDEGGGSEAAKLFERAMEIELEVGSPVEVRGAAGGASAGGIAMLGPRIANSYWDLFSRTEHEQAGFGRYTYVVFPFVSDAGNGFIEKLLHVTNPVVGISLPKERLNLFYMPVKPQEADTLRSTGIKAGRGELSLEPKAVLAAYDYGYASEILTSYCLRAEPRPPDCDHAQASGPYILTLPEPWTEVGNVSSAALLVDASGSEPEVQVILVDAIRAAAQQDQPSGLDRLAQLKIAVANALVRSGAIAEKVAEEMPKLTKLVHR